MVVENRRKSTIFIIQSIVTFSHPKIFRNHSIDGACLFSIKLEMVRSFYNDTVRNLSMDSILGQQLKGKTTLGSRHIHIYSIPFLMFSCASRLCVHDIVIIRHRWYSLQGSEGIFLFHKAHDRIMDPQREPSFWSRDVKMPATDNTKLYRKPSCSLPDGSKENNKSK